MASPNTIKLQKQRNKARWKCVQFVSMPGVSRQGMNRAARRAAERPRKKSKPLKLCR